MQCGHLSSRRFSIHFSKNKTIHLFVVFALQTLNIKMLNIIHLNMMVIGYGGRHGGGQGGRQGGRYGGRHGLFSWRIK